jgi:ubiquinone/menaquinone biosynthesis C-methylase UbiE/DNA-binding transcriptional ArsR family regulator
MASMADTVDLLRLFGDATRVRLASLLDRDELTVAEMTRITNLPQSRVSTHLGKLREAGLLRDRRAGASTYYSINDGAMPADVRRIWTLVASGLDEPLLRADRDRCAALLRARESGMAQGPDSVAGQMERYYSPGRTWEATARGLLGLVRLGDVLDAGSGDGAVASLLAPRARTITCLDRSEKALEAARHRLGYLSNVTLVPGDLHALPFESERFDQVLLFNVLVHAENPARVIDEAARVCRRGGDLVVTTLATHAHREATAAYGHVHAGFSARKLAQWLGAAQLTVERCEISSREKRPPHHEVITAFAHKPEQVATTGVPKARTPAGPAV